MTTIYKDINGEEIKEGMHLKNINDGTIELVYKGDDGDLGFNASNENWSGFSEWLRELYPLYQFPISKEYVIVKRGIEDENNL
ncbi:MAG: hypothetical protein ACRDA5_02330 [Clostridium sp.]